MALPEDFSKIYGSTATGGLTPISDVNYTKGWEFVGSNPPTKNDFSYLQNLSDLKSQWLYSNKLQRTDPFGDIKADGIAAVAAALANLGLGTAASKDVGTGSGQIPDMSAFSSGTKHFKLPGGYIVQWGFGQSFNGAFVSTYQVPFTNNNYCLVPIVYSTLGAAAIAVANTNSLTTANINVVNPSGQGLNASMGYLVVGKL